MTVIDITRIIFSALLLCTSLSIEAAAQEADSPYLPAECDEELAKLELLYSGQSIQEHPIFFSEDRFREENYGNLSPKVRDYYFLAEQVLRLFSKSIDDVQEYSEVAALLAEHQYFTQRDFLKHPTVEILFRGAEAAPGCKGKVAVCLVRSCSTDPDGKECRAINIASAKSTMILATKKQVAVLNKILRRIQVLSRSKGIAAKVTMLKNRVNLLKEFQLAYQTAIPSTFGYAWHCYRDLYALPTPTPTPTSSKVTTLWR